MADPVAGVEKIVKLGLAIKGAVDTARHNEEECHEIRKRVLRFSAILSQLQQTGMMNGSPAMSGAAGGPGGDARAGPQACRRVPGEDHRPPPHRRRGPVEAAAPGQR